MRTVFGLVVASIALSLLACQPGTPRGDAEAGFINFETIPTRAVAMSPDGSRLYALNVPDGRLAIFAVGASGISLETEVPVGLDPISLAVRGDSEVWVVNHLSDSVSIVDVAASPPRVVRTLLVGDEPRDITFAGPGRSRAFVTAARRGQNHPADTVAETQLPGIGRADVWVFDANALGESLGGDPLAIVTLFADKPGPIAASPDGSEVFVAIFTSGNRTSVISDRAICGPTGPAGRGQISRQDDGPCALENGRTSPGGVPGPNVGILSGLPNPRVGVIVRNDPETGAWRDVLGRDHRAAVPFTLPDNDVFVLDANANPPVERRVYGGVATLQFGLAVHPTNGRAYVASTEAINTNRFLSLPAGLPAFGIPPLGPNLGPGLSGSITIDPITRQTLRGHLYESRIAVLSPDGSQLSRHLNKHIDYEAFPTPPGTLERSVGSPQGLAFSPDGETLYVAAFGSNKIVPFSRAALEDDSFVPDAATHIELGGLGGATDLVLDPNDANRMFAYKRFDNAVAVVDLASRSEVATAPLHNPEPDRVRLGRRFFYDTRLGSDNGEQSCAVCHPGGDKDDLAWNIAIPFLPLDPNPNTFVQGVTRPRGTEAPTVEFNPIKGPMTVLTLRGIKDSGPMLWRGDITNDADPLDERADFQNPMRGFNIAYDVINGKTGGLAPADFDAVTDWALTLVPPPNPHRPLDGTLTASQQQGRDIFRNAGDGASGVTDDGRVCVTCHALDRGLGQFGTGGQMSNEGETQFFKVPQLRTTYDKVGMFGHTFGDNGSTKTLGGPRVDVGPQIRGTGTQHDGSAAGAEEFLSANVFQLDALELRAVTDFVYAFESNVAPIVGQQVTLRAQSGPDVHARVDLLETRARAPFVMAGPIQTTECDLVARGVIDGAARGFVYLPAENAYLGNDGVRVPADALRGQARTPGQELTFTCLYPGAGTRAGIDRDLDGVLDGGAPDPR